MTVLLDITERPVLLLGSTLNLEVRPSGLAGSEALGVPKADSVVQAPGISPETTIESPSVQLILSPTGISAGTESFGTASVRFGLGPAGISGGSSVGSLQANAKIGITSIGSGVAFGVADAFTSMNPDGVDAAGSGAASPRVTLVLRPEGIASAEVFGDPDTLATVFVVPGPYDPTNEFGDATATKYGWVFRPPVNTYKWRLFKEYEGISLLKESGVWSEVAHPDLERTRSAEIYLAGGRDHVVSSSLKTELEALGYTVVQEPVTTEEYVS